MAENEKLEQAAQAGSDKAKKDKKADKTACVIVVGVFIWIFDYIAGSAIDVLLTLLR